MEAHRVGAESYARLHLLQIIRLEQGKCSRPQFQKEEKDLIAYCEIYNAVDYLE